MLSLRTRFTALLVISVVLVLVIAAFVTATLLRKPSEVAFDHALAEKAELAALLLRVDPSTAERLHIRIQQKPARKRIDQEATDSLLAEGRRQGYTSEVVVLESFNPHTKDIAVRLDGDRWAYLDAPDSGPFPILPLATYLTFVAIGMAGISIYVSNVMMRPLRILDETITKIRPDGIIPELPETGPVEVRTTAKAINRLATRLNAAVSSRMRMIAAAGHDMRTPMTRMRLRAEFVVDCDDKNSWLKDLDELDHIADSAIRLVREEVSPAAQEEVALDALLRSVTEEIRETELPVEQGTIAPVFVKGAPFALKRAIRNLVVNAATHGQGARVVLSRNGAEAVLAITDRGPGIPQDLLDRVFEPFFRVDQARRQLVPGAGLGLAISQEIIENHGGTIAIANRRDGGLLQTVRLPLCVAKRA
ncbi:ATP-binding protein [Pararhizobium sp. BT-229]|uniref:ATP-binding protein n=1 Tax=Pararhizobium sp. BT-229 TaxID=2986923 RepID=UPI0021F6DE36|nr:ATP-binding protein [Pararhizobium sp. BT-229]MCV9966586.1 ATP-binding protein [Pararhizobium sp. BT-229]